MTKVTLTVDTEEEWKCASGYSRSPGGLTNIYDGVPLFHEFCMSLGLKVTYFTNFSVLRDNHASSILQSLAKDDCTEIGLHIHPWNTPPFDDNQSDYPFHSFLHNLSPELAAAKLNTIFDLFFTTGINPTSYRGGRYSTSRQIQEYLASRGVIADASILPFTGWHDPGAPNFFHRDNCPVRRGFGSRGSVIWEIPLTLSFTRGPERFWARFFQSASRRPWSSFRLIGICEKLVCRRVWVNLENPLTEGLPKLLKVLRARNLPHINITLHSSSLVVGKSPYVTSSQELDRLKSRLLHCVEVFSNWSDYTPATITEVANNLEREYHARPRN